VPGSRAFACADGCSAGRSSSSLTASDGMTYTNTPLEECQFRRGTGCIKPATEVGTMTWRTAPSRRRTLPSGGGDRALRSPKGGRAAGLNPTPAPPQPARDFCPGSHARSAPRTARARRPACDSFPRGTSCSDPWAAPRVSTWRNGARSSPSHRRRAGCIPRACRRWSVWACAFLPQPVSRLRPWGIRSTPT